MRICIREKLRRLWLFTPILLAETCNTATTKGPLFLLQMLSDNSHTQGFLSHKVAIPSLTVFQCHGQHRFNDIILLSFLVSFLNILLYPRIYFFMLSSFSIWILYIISFGVLTFLSSTTFPIFKLTMTQTISFIFKKYLVLKSIQTFTKHLVIPGSVLGVRNTRVLGIQNRCRPVL